MKNLQYLILAGSLIVLSAFTINNSINWKISDTHSIKFSGTDATGVFKTLTGDVAFNPSDLSTSKFSFEIDVKSINTGNGMQNKHAVGKKWFQASTYPKITFNSSELSKTESGYQAKGIMEIHGVKKEMTLPFTFSDNSFKSKFSVNRLDFKVGTMKGMSKKVSNEIKLDITIPVTK